MTRIYLVDDQLLLRDGLHALLETAGHDVVGEGSDPTQAVVEAQQRQAEVMLLDLGLGERSGFEVLQELKKRDSAVRAIVLTMSSQPRHVAEAVRLGAAGYVLKDSGAAELLQAIDSVSGGRRFFGPQVAALALQALADDTPADPFGTLSPRERQIVTMVVNGMSSSAIGAELHLSPKTVDTYRSRIMTKLGVAGVTALVRLAVREGLVDG
ncbi:response regulator transcription factor [Aquabacterium sp.]|uniref:response regulator transcription factor n=1 Tax=Aquabacterium sp. TaxID=1872578 RepID=UPI002D09A44C|nr:response regulator transcription factor [Aquabacterium sp.]HSW06194.1 response regulator transcription factor [Aquabacterium sp.]